jgi:hypothetical protein
LAVVANEYARPIIRHEESLWLGYENREEVLANFVRHKAAAAAA